MAKQRSSMRQVPWQSWEHWKWVATELFSDSAERISAALDRITAWQSRGNVPIAVESTAALIGIHQRDPQVNPGLAQESGLPEELLRMMYAMAIQRLVNGVVDQSHKRSTTSVADRAELAGLPRLLVDIRHEAAHTELPGLSLLQVASKQALAWLKFQYWDQQRETLMNARMIIKSKLVEHCLLVVEILSPSAAAADCQHSKDEEADELYKEKPWETLTVKKQQRSNLFSELLDLSLSSTSDLVSVLVDDGLLEQHTLPTLDDVDGKEPTETDSTDSPHLASVADNAWKFTLRRLCFQLPRLPGMLLVAILHRINSTRSQKCGSTLCHWTDPEESTPSLTSTETIPGKITEMVSVDFIPRSRLISWCAWLLGKQASEDLNISLRLETPKSKLLRMSDALSVKADLSEELLCELLKMCFFTSAGSGPLVELVSLIAIRVGSKRFQHRATALAQLGISMQRLQRNLMSRPENQETGLIIIPKERTEEGPLKKVVTCSPTSHVSKSDPDCSGQAESWIDGSESALQIARMQQLAFLDRLASQRTIANTNDQSCNTHIKSDLTLSLPSTATSASSDCQLKNNDSLYPSVGPKPGVSDFGRWTVVENWQPCAIGMIPSQHHLTGIMPSLELVGTIHRGQVGASKQPGDAASEKNPSKDTTLTQINTGILTVADAVEEVRGKRRNEQLDAFVSGKRPKKTGCHVQFEDRSPSNLVEKDVASPCRTSNEESWRLNLASPQKEQVQQGSSIDGCLWQNGVLMHVAPKQLDSLQSAVHVLYSVWHRMATKHG